MRTASVIATAVLVAVGCKARENHAGTSSQAIAPSALAAPSSSAQRSESPLAQAARRALRASLATDTEPIAVHDDPVQGILRIDVGASYSAPVKDLRAMVNSLSAGLSDVLASRSGKVQIDVRFEGNCRRAVRRKDGSTTTGLCGVLLDDASEYALAAVLEPMELTFKNPKNAMASDIMRARQRGQVRNAGPNALDITMRLTADPGKAAGSETCSGGKCIKPGVLFADAPLGTIPAGATKKFLCDVDTSKTWSVGPAVFDNEGVSIWMDHATFSLSVSADGKQTALYSEAAKQDNEDLVERIAEVEARFGATFSGLRPSELESAMRATASQPGRDPDAQPLEESQRPLAHSSASSPAFRLPKAEGGSSAREATAMGIWKILELHYAKQHARSGAPKHLVLEQRSEGSTAPETTFETAKLGGASAVQ